MLFRFISNNLDDIGHEQALVSLRAYKISFIKTFHFFFIGYKAFFQYPEHIFALEHVQNIAFEISIELS